MGVGAVPLWLQSSTGRWLSFSHLHSLHLVQQFPFFLKKNLHNSNQLKCFVAVGHLEGGGVGAGSTGGMMSSQLGTMLVQ